MAENEFEKRVNAYNTLCTYKDITYKKIGDLELTLDILMPENKSSKTPVVLYIHGGGWKNGAKSSLGAPLRFSTVQKLLKDGYAVVSATYSLTSDEVTFPQNIIDSKDALRWVKKNAENYGFDAQNIGLWGSSAGAHLVMMVAYTDDNLFQGVEELKNYDTKVKYVVNEFGPICMRMIAVQTPEPRMMELVRHILGKEFDFRYLTDEDYDKMNRYFPYEQVTKSAPPTLSLQGTNDLLVPHIHAQLLDLKLRNCGCKSELFLVEDGNHGLGNINDEQVEFYATKTVDFIKKYS